MHTQIHDSRSGNQTPATTQGGESVHVADSHQITQTIGGNESEDSAMDESPISDVRTSESKALFP